MKDERVRKILENSDNSTPASLCLAFDQLLDEIRQEHEIETKELLEDSVALELYLFVEKDARHYHKKLKKIKKLLKGI